MLEAKRTNCCGSYSNKHNTSHASKSSSYT